MSRSQVVISGQIYGKVDWVSQDGTEVGLFINSSSRGSTRCIVSGSEAKSMLANRMLSKGMMVSAHGELFARAIYRQKEKTHIGEVVCEASRIIAEPSRSVRVAGSVHGLLKGVVMHWSPQFNQLKTFINFKEKGKPSQLTCSLFMNNWISALKGEAKDNFVSALKPGRVFTSSCLIEAGVYVDKEDIPIPVLQLLPLDFRLQG